MFAALALDAAKGAGAVRSLGRTMAISTEQAWAEMSGKLRGYFRRRVSDQHLAEDLVQETFLRIHNGIHSLKDDERLAAWVYRMAPQHAARPFPQRRAPLVAVDDPARRSRGE